MLRALPEQLFDFFLVEFLDQTFVQRDAAEYEVPLGNSLHQLGPEQLRSICLNRGDTRNVGHTNQAHRGSNSLRNDGCVVLAHAGEGLEAYCGIIYHAGVVLVRDNSN